MVHPPEIESRLATFLHDLVLAWRHRATYPPGHPARAGGVETTCAALADLLAHTGPLEIGVLPDALLVRGEREGTPNAVRIAHRLSSWRVAVLAFAPGLGEEDVTALIDRLAGDPRKVARERFADGLLGQGEGAVRVREIDYGTLALVDPTGERAAGAGERSVWSAVVENLLAGTTTGRDATALLRVLPTEEATAALKRLAAAPGGLAEPLLGLARELGLAGAEIVSPTARELTEELHRHFGQGDLDAGGWGAEPGTVEPDLPAWDPAFRLDDPSFPALDENLSGGSSLQHLVQTTLELLAGQDDPELLGALGGRLADLVRELVLDARLREAIDVVERLRRMVEDGNRPEPSRRAVRAALERLASREGSAPLVEILGDLPPAQLERARQLVDRLGATAVPGLLEALAEEEGRSRRNHLLAFLVSLEGRAVPQATVMLRDSRWYVVRNMLVLLRQIGDPASLGEVRRLAQHADLRVKLEAIRSLFALENEPPTELLAAVLHDPDPKVAEAAITLAGSRGFLEAAVPLVALLQPRDLLGRRRALRVRALQALGQLGLPETLPALRRYARRFSFPPVAAEERRAFFHSLAGYPAEARQPYVRQGLLSADPEVREVCRRLCAAEGSR